MAEELVVEDILTASMISAGEVLIRKLDELNWPVTAALWYYYSDSSQWRLIIASPHITDAGPRDGYRQIQEALGKLPGEVPHVRLQDVVVTKPSHPIISMLSSAIRTGPGLEHVRFRENVINGTFVEDALIYRLDESPSAA